MTSTVLILTRDMAATASSLPAALYMQLAARYDVYKDAG
jgi:hypothetical protein